jgi:hypothetical protein
MFETDYIDVDRFVCDYDEMNYDPSENQEIEYEISEDGDYWVDDGYGDDDRYDQEDYETSDW